MGSGANILISDAGFNGLVIKPKLNNIKINNINSKINSKNILVTAGSGVEFSDLINFCLNNNILGLEEFSGIPGTVGGSVFINLHYFEFLLSQFLVSAEVINKNTQEVLSVDNSWFEFGYNKSKLNDHNYYLLNATFKLTKASDLEVAYAKGRNFEIIRYRTSRYPNKNTCGSFFRNFHEHEVNLKINNKPMIYIAYYLDKLGIKGVLKSGQAQVSYQHANMLVNLGKATSQDIVNLAKEMQTLVYNKYKIIPKPECLFIGFDKYPLLK